MEIISTLPSRVRFHSNGIIYRLKGKDKLVTVEKVLAKWQESIYEKDGIRTDVYYSEGKGALAVREGLPLSPQNVIGVIDEGIIHFARNAMHMNGNIKFNL